VQEVEDRTVEAFKAVRDDRRFQETCARVARYSLYVTEGPSFTLPEYSEQLAGVTHCQMWNPHIVVGNRNPPASALAHEIAHAVQDCDPRADADSRWPRHEGWTERGIFAAIEATR
jgi:hypothetical protein